MRAGLAGRGKGDRLATYLFIDGAYLRARLTYIARHFSIDPLDFDYRSFSAGAQKAFYYDCLPAQSSGESVDAYNSRVQPERKELNRIRGLPGYHVFLGEAIRSGKTIRQKGVDILIAVHMLTHAFRGVMDRALLLAGDRDFVPLVLALVQQGIYVIVAYHPKSVSEELLDAADDRIEYDTPSLWRLTTPLFKTRYPAPISEILGGELSNPDDFVLHKGKVGTEEIQLYTKAGDCQLHLPFTDEYGVNKVLRIRHRDRAVIDKLLEERGVVTWV
jgi:uncharacterized LabA/DUF88 family protein